MAQSKIKLVCLSSFSLLLVQGSVYAAENDSRPNILLIMVDDLGWGDLSVNGGRDIRTPNIDKLFEEGTSLINHYSNCTVCSPTRASLLTGLYPDMAGVPGVIRTDVNNSWGYFSPGAITLPDMLREGGYKTAIIGKWHLGLETPNLPGMRGFEYFKGFLGDMMDDYYNHLRHGNNYMRLNDDEIKPEGHATDLFTQWTIDYFQMQQGCNDPFFLFLSYNAPHFPIQPPDEWYNEVLLREKGIDPLRARNVAFVEHLDAGIGRVMQALKASGLDRNTLVIFTSDNGGSIPHGALNIPLRGGKQDHFEGGIKVPGVMIWPGKIRAGSETPVVCLTMDFYPTLCEIAGIPVSHEIDGISLWPYINGKDPAMDERILFWVRREGGRYGGKAYYAARKGPFKILQNNPYEYFQFFNVETDPFEQSPLDTGLPQFNELRNSLSQHIRRSGAVQWQNLP
jgi:arylsulfatase A-like enzyme